MAGKAKTRECGIKVNQLLRALGLSPSSTDPLATEQLSATERINVLRAPAFPFESDVKFIALAVGTTPTFEAEDHVHGVTAIGVASLDTSRLKYPSGLCPGEDGRHWAAEIETRVVAITGRQGHKDAAALTAGAEVEHMSVEEVRMFLTDGLSSLGRLFFVFDHVDIRRRQLHSEFRCYLSDSNNTLATVDVLALHNAAFAPTEPSRAPRTLRELCATLTIDTDNMHSLPTRAKRTLETMLAMAIRVAPAPAARVSASVKPATRLQAPEATPAGSISKGQDTGVTKPATAQDVTKPATAQDVAKPATAQETARSTSPTPTTLVAKTTPAATANPPPSATVAKSLEPQPIISVLPTTPVAKSTPAVTSKPPPSATVAKSPEPQPIVSVTSYNVTDFTPGDRKEVRVTNDEILYLPLRIRERVKCYTDKTDAFVQNPIATATATGFSNISVMTKTLSDPRTGICRQKIKGPITNFENLVGSNCRVGVATGTGIANVEEIIVLRTFVSDWYSNVPGISSKCAVAEKTVAHRAFTDMLRRLVLIMRGKEARTG
ncbi:hypothetical protein LTR08_000131 [Meristemomyces frigidus]|nr:hypothetical protein LTR08_000131 [Meristemomyces frigidus]